MRHLPLLALLLSVTACATEGGNRRELAAGPGYQPGTAYPSAAAQAPGKHYFEGVIDYAGVHGKPPGKPFSMHCLVRGQDLRCDVNSSDSKLPIAIGFRGPGSTLCVNPGGGPGWIPISMTTIGFLFTLFPEDIRKKAIQQTQSQYRWTGGADNILGYGCRELEDRSEEGLRLTCYSADQYFEGDQKLVPVLHQMGFDPGFVSSLSDGGIGWKSREWDKDGTPSFDMQATRIQPGQVNPAAFAGVCGMP